PLFPYTTLFRSQTLTTTSGDSATIAIVASTVGVVDVDLVFVEDANGCSQAQSGTATVTINALPTAAISGDATLCQDSPMPNVTFTGADGVAPYTFTYTLNGGAPTTVVSVGNAATVAAPTDVAGVFEY